MDLDKKEAIKALQRNTTQDVRVDSEQRAPILKSMMKISNKLKTAAKVFDVFLKESSTRGISSRSNGAIFKLSQTNCDFLI